MIICTYFQLRQSAYRIQQLESELVEKGSHEVLSKVNSHNDPKGYFSTLLLHPDTPEEHFEEMLKRSWRVLGLRYHPDKNNGDDTRFKKLNEAFAFLSDPGKRKEYLTAAASNTFRKNF